MKRFAIVFLAILFLSGPVAAAAQPCKEPKITIESENLSGYDEKGFEQVLRAAIKKVCTWWGPTYTGAFTINIEDSRGPSMALVPGWRGNRGTMLFRTRPTKAGRTAVTHEVVHVFAPNGNRFLAEGLAVYAHEHLGGRQAYPLYHHELDGAAKQYLEVADLSAMDALALPKRLQIDRLSESEAYIVAGSFFKFLIETHGMEKFRRLYAMTPMVPRSKTSGGSPGRWRDVYGVDLKTLEKAWKAKMSN